MHSKLLTAVRAHKWTSTSLQRVGPTGHYGGLAYHDFSPWGLRVIVHPTVCRKEGSPITAFSKNRPL